MKTENIFSAKVDNNNVLCRRDVNIFCLPVRDSQWADLAAVNGGAQ
jgi:hypothetical protein